MGVLDFLKRPAPPARVVSKPYDFYLPAIAAGAVFRFSIDAHLPEARRYKPMNFLEIYNPSLTRLTVRYESEGGELFQVEAGGSRIIRSWFNNLIITNAGANNLAANLAILTLQRQ